MFWYCSMWNLSFPPRDWTPTHYSLQEVLTTGPPGKSLFITYWSSTTYKALYLPLLCLVAQSCLTLGDPMDYTGSSVHGDSPGKNTGVGCHSLLQGIFPTQRMNSGLPHCRWILYHLSQKGSPRILEWVAYPFSRGSSWPRNGWDFLHCRQILFQWSYQGSPNLPLHLHKEREQRAYQARLLPLQATATLRLTFCLGCSWFSRSYIEHHPGTLSWSLPSCLALPFWINGTTHLSTWPDFFLFFS